MFIDTNEIEEILGEYYDFSEWTEKMWADVDAEIERECAARGITYPDGGDEEYYAICDGVIGKYLKKM